MFSKTLKDLLSASGGNFIQIQIWSMPIRNKAYLFHNCLDHSLDLVYKWYTRNYITTYITKYFQLPVEYGQSISNDSLLLFWRYSHPGTAICITSGRAQKDVPLRTIVYSPTSEYAIFEASFMLLAHLLTYHFVVLCQGRPSSFGDILNII